MKRHEYINYYVNDFAIRKNLETGEYEVVENIPDYKLLVWKTFENSMYGYEEAQAYVKELVKPYSTIYGL